MKKIVALVGAMALACGGLGGPSEFALETAQMIADENQGVECRLSATGGGSIEFMDWSFDFGDAITRPYPEEMKPIKDVWGKVTGQRKYMAVVPVAVTNNLPKRRSFDRLIKWHRTDGVIYDAKTKIPDWVLEAIGKPNLATDTAAYGPKESRETFLMLSVDDPESAVGGVFRMSYTERRPDPNNPRRTTHQVQDHICVELAAVEEVDPLPEP